MTCNNEMWTRIDQKGQIICHQPLGNRAGRDPVEAAREGEGARSSSGIADAARDMLKRDDRAHAQNLQHS